MTSDSVIDFDHMNQIEKLHRLIGVEESHRLGFTFVDNTGVTRLATAGLGYLLFALASNDISPQEAFAAGYQCASEFHCNALDV